MMWRKKFLRFLKEEGAYQLYIDNLYKSHPTTDLDFWKFGLKKIFNEKEKCAEAIFYAFYWADTRQGCYFWSKLNNKWKDKLRNCYHSI